MMKKLLFIMIGGSILLTMLLCDLLFCQETAAPQRNESDLNKALAQLAKSADLHESLQYKIQCTENLKRMVHRRSDSSASFGFLPSQTIIMKHGILITRDEHGVPSETRIKLDSKGHVALDRKGLPKEMSLSMEFDPIVNAYPFSQIAWFTTKNQKNLNFHLLSEKDKTDSRFLIQCSNPGELAIEFLDKKAPIMVSKLPEGHCSALASGQLCLNPISGEVSLIDFYPLHPTEDGCVWELSYPFAVIEQNVVERSTGARFPSRVETMVFLSWRDTAVFTQTFEECVFSDVRVIESYFGAKEKD